MADNDIELSVGIKLDDAQFTNEYQSKLSELSKATQTQIQGAMDELSGPASKQWGTLPFAGMHDPKSGNVIATQAFLSSLSRDLQGAGYSGTSYESALINATYRSSMADPMQRYHRMLAMGLTQQADLTHPDTALGKIIETDYALMSQPWSRDFIKTTDYRGQKRSYIDFAGMREYAVEAGLGRWIDEGENAGKNTADNSELINDELEKIDEGENAGKNTADNFELINDELEKIDEKSIASKKTFSDWNDTLKGVLGTLTAIGGLAGVVATLAAVVKAFEGANKASEAGTVAAGTTLDKRRAFIGMSALDELKTKVASKSVGLGEDAVKNEIYTMSENIEQYKLMGQGDALPPALLGIFNNLMTAEDPYDIYTKSADEIYKQLKGADDATRRRWLMLMNKAGLGSMSSLVGQFLSNPEYAQKYKTPSALFDLKRNPFYGVYPEAETMLPQISQLNESLKASYSQLYKDWEKAFGLPFKTWWDNTLKDKIVPWFERLISLFERLKSMLGLDKTPEQKEAGKAITGLRMILLGSDRDKAIAKAINKNNALADVPGYKAQNGPIAYHSYWGSWFGGKVEQTGRAANAIWNLYGRVADYSDKDIEAIENPTQRMATKDVVERVRKMRGKLDDVGLADFLKNTKGEDIDKYLLRAMQVGVYSNSPDWEANFDSYIDSILKLGLRGNTDDEIIKLLERIATNTEVSEEVTKNDKFWEIITLQYGSAVAEDWRSKLVNR